MRCCLVTCIARELKSHFTCQVTSFHGHITFLNKTVNKAHIGLFMVVVYSNLKPFLQVHFWGMYFELVPKTKKVLEFWVIEAIPQNLSGKVLRHLQSARLAEDSHATSSFLTAPLCSAYTAKLSKSKGLTCLDYELPRRSSTGHSSKLLFWI